ncbi:MAG: co-chaperone GroES [Bacteroidales bacterium]|nr:co-chaperone GroES [Bacteroidales bacterium]
MNKLIVVGDRVLIKPKSEDSKTSGGLYLPPGYREKEEVQSGYVMKTGPGYPIPAPNDDFDEPWKPKDDNIHYIPLQVKVGDLAIFLKKGTVEVHYRGEKYYIVSQYSILLLERDED